jgi:hypothetical protein
MVHHYSTWSIMSEFCGFRLLNDSQITQFWVRVNCQHNDVSALTVTILTTTPSEGI